MFCQTNLSVQREARMGETMKPIYFSYQQRLMPTALIVCLSIGLFQPVAGQTIEARVAEIEKSGGWHMTKTRRVRKSSVKAGVVISLIPHPKEKLVSILRDYPNYPQLIHFLRSAKVLEEKSKTEHVLKFHAEILKGSVDLRAKLRATVVESDPKKQIVRLEKLSGNLESMNAIFTLESVSDQQTLVTVDLHLDPDLWYVPDGTLTDYNQVNARRITRALKKKADSLTSKPVTDQSN